MNLPVNRANVRELSELSLLTCTPRAATTIAKRMRCVVHFGSEITARCAEHSGLDAKHSTGFVRFCSVLVVMQEPTEALEHWAAA